MSPKKTESTCQYEGQTYSSLFDAAKQLGIAAPYLYKLRDKNNLTADETIAQAMDDKLKGIRKNSGNRKPCVVEGVIYCSKDEALKAYDVPYVTVKSRMDRAHISFEEAITKGNKFRKYYSPALTLFTKSSLKVNSEINIDEQPKIKRELILKLKSLNYNPQFYSIEGSDALVIRINEMFSTKTVANCYILIAETHIELVVADVIHENTSINELAWLKQLNDINMKYAGTKIWYEEDPRTHIKAVYVGSSIIRAKKWEIGVQSVIAALLSLLGACQQILKDYNA